VISLKYFFGIDGGGTKTAICATSSDAAKIVSEITSNAAWRERGIDAVIWNIKDVIYSLLPCEDAQIGGIAMGLPCFGESTDGDRELTKAAHTAFPGIPLYLTNDVEVGWAGALGLSPGINVVAGTGAIAYGKDEQGKTARCGGWSEFFGDEGSCFWMGRKVMKLFSKQSDGRMAKDRLYDIVRKEFSLQSDFDFIDLMYNKYIGHRDTVASLQLLAKKAALEGSPSAKSLYVVAADELLLCVNAIRNRLQFNEQPFKVSCTGGLFKCGNLILDSFNDGVEEIGGVLHTAKFEPLYGALLLAFEHFNNPKIPILVAKLETV